MSQERIILTARRTGGRPVVLALWHGFEEVLEQFSPRGGMIVAERTESIARYYRFVGFDVKIQCTEEFAENLRIYSEDEVEVIE